MSNLPDSDVSGVTSNEIMDIIQEFTQENLWLSMGYLFLVFVTMILNVVFVNQFIARMNDAMSKTSKDSATSAAGWLIFYIGIAMVSGYATDLIENRLFPMFTTFAEKRLFKLIINKNKTDVESTNPNRFREMMLRTSSSAAHIYQQILYTLVPNAVTILVMLGYTFYIDWRCGLVLLGTFAASGLMLSSFQKEILQRAQDHEKKYKLNEWRVFDVMSNMNLVINKNMDEDEYEDLCHRMDTVCDEKMTYYQHIDNVGYAVRATVFVGVACVLMLMAFSVCEGMGQEKTQKLMSLLALVIDVRGRTDSVAKSQINTIDSYGKFTFIEKDINLLKQKHISAIDDETESGSVWSNKFDIDIQDVSFTYTKKDKSGHTVKNKVLHNVTLKIDETECVAIVGPSGSGKSSLARILLKNATQDSGHVRIGGVDINKIPVHELRKHIGLVNQDQGILERSIYENICYSCEKDPLTKPKVIKLWKKLAKKVFAKRDMHSSVGALAGNELSTGQKTLIRVANMIICRKNEICIFDEPTQGLDEDTKVMILSLISEIIHMRQCTVILITHDDECMAIADRIVRMDKGKISQ